MVRDWRLFQGLPRPLRLLVFSQLVFNAGFYLVVPFLASYLEDDLRLGGALSASSWVCVPFRSRVCSSWAGH